MTTDTEKTNQCWSSVAEKTQEGKKIGSYWWDAGPEIHRYKNRKISGNPDLDWMQYTLNRYFNGKLPMARCLSLGCGQGPLERTLAKLGAFQECDAYDIAEGAIKVARELAHTEGFNNISYHVADLNKLELPSNLYNSVWIMGAMHHFKELEYICQQIQKTLKPGGLLILDEYIGPNRFQFPARQKEVVNLSLQLLPPQYRLRDKESVDRERRVFTGGKQFISRLKDKIRDGDLLNVIRRRLLAYKSVIRGDTVEKETVNFPTARDVIAADPSEAIRSDEIVEVLQQYFEIIEMKGWGGNILQFLLADIADNFSDSEDEHAQTFLRMLMDIEDTFLRCDQFKSDFAYIVARPLVT